MKHINDILNSNQKSRINFSKIISFNIIKDKIQKSLNLHDNSIISVFFSNENTIIINCKSNTIKNFIMNKMNNVRSIIPKEYVDKNIKLKVFIRS